MEWLVGFDIDVAGVETRTHLLIQASSSETAIKGVQFMGGTWWSRLQQEQHGHWWRFAEGEIWLCGLTLIDEQASAVLHQLSFLDCWQATELSIVDEYGNDWRDIER